MDDEQIKAAISRACDEIRPLPSRKWEKDDWGKWEEVGWNDVGKSDKNLAFSAYVQNGKDIYGQGADQVDEYTNLYWIYVLSRLYKTCESVQKRKWFKDCRINDGILQKLDKTGDLEFTFSNSYLSYFNTILTVEAHHEDEVRKVANASLEELLQLLPAPAPSAAVGGRRSRLSKKLRSRRAPRHRLRPTPTRRKRSRR
jgi:hypothetical protein